MKKYLVNIGQIAMGLVAGKAISDTVNKVVEVTKKAVETKKGKSHN